jgi:hypothetical protein
VICWPLRIGKRQQRGHSTDIEINQTSASNAASPLQLAGSKSASILYDRLRRSNQCERSAIAVRGQ